MNTCNIEQNCQALEKVKFQYDASHLYEDHTSYSIRIRGWTAPSNRNTLEAHPFVIDVWDIDGN